MKKRGKDTRVEEITWVYSGDIVIGNEPSCVYGTVEVEEFELPETEDYAVLTIVDRERADKAYPKTKVSV